MRWRTRDVWKSLCPSQVAEENQETPVDLQPFSRGQLPEPLLKHVMVDLEAVSLDTPRASDTVAAAYNALRVAHLVIVETIPAPPASQALFFMALDFLNKGLDWLSRSPSADSILADGPSILVMQTLEALAGQCLDLSELTLTKWTWVFTVLARAVRMEGLDRTFDPYQRRTWYATLLEGLMSQVAEENEETPVDLQPFSRGQLAEPLLKHVMVDLEAVSLDTPRASDTVAAAYNALRVAHLVIVETIPALPASQALFFMALINFLNKGLDWLSSPPSADSILADGSPILVMQTLETLAGQCLDLSELTVTKWTWVFTVLARAVRYQGGARLEGKGAVCDMALQTSSRLLKLLPPVLKEGGLGDAGVSSRDLLEALVMRALDKGGKVPAMALQAMQCAEAAGVLVLHPDVALLKDLLKRPAEALTRFNNLRETVKTDPEVALSITEMVLKLVDVTAAFNVKDTKLNPPLIQVINDALAHALSSGTQGSTQGGAGTGGRSGGGGAPEWIDVGLQRAKRATLCQRALLTHRALLRALTDCDKVSCMSKELVEGLLWPLKQVLLRCRSDAPHLLYVAFENLNILLHDGRRLWTDDLFAQYTVPIACSLLEPNRAASEFAPSSPAVDMGLRMLCDLFPQALTPDMLDPATAAPRCEWKPLTPLSDDKAYAACVDLLIRPCRYLPRKKPCPPSTANPAAAEAANERYRRARRSCFRRLCVLLFAPPRQSATTPSDARLGPFLHLLLGLNSDHRTVTLRPVLRREMVVEALSLLVPQPSPLLLPRVPDKVWARVAEHYTPPSSTAPTPTAPLDLTTVLLALWCALVDASEPASLLPPSPLPPPSSLLPFLLGSLARFEAPSPPSPLPFFLLYQACLQSYSLIPSSDKPCWSSDPSLPSSLLPLLPRALSHAAPCPSLSPSPLPHLLPRWLELLDQCLTRDPEHAMSLLSPLSSPRAPCPSLLASLWSPLLHGFFRTCRSFFNALPPADEAKKHSRPLLSPVLQALALYFHTMQAALAQATPTLCICGMCGDDKQGNHAGVMLGLLRQSLQPSPALLPSSTRSPDVLPLLSEPLTLCLSRVGPCRCAASVRSLAEKAVNALLTSPRLMDLQPKDAEAVQALLPHLQPMLHALLTNNNKPSREVFWSFWDATFGKVQHEALKPILPAPLLDAVLAAAAQRPAQPPATPKTSERRLSGGGSGKRGSFALTSPSARPLARTPSINSAKKARPST